MKNKKIIFGVIGVLVVITGAVFFGVFKKGNSEEKVSESVWPSISIPNSDMTANLAPDPNFVPDEVSEPALILVIKNADGSIYKEIPSPSTTATIYVSDGTYVYVGGDMPEYQQKNIYRINIETGKAEHIYFGSLGEMHVPGEIKFSESGRYLAYTERVDKESGSYALFVHDFKTTKGKKFAVLPNQDDFNWEGDKLNYFPEGGDTPKESVIFE